MAEDTALLLLWDVDHTLIENGGVSKENYALAFEILTGRAPEAQPQTDGRTDQGIMANLLASNGEDPDAYSLKRQWDALLKAGNQNKAALAERGYALPGAAACLESISGEVGIRQTVLTGNIRPNAMTKLQTFALDKWIDWEIGGFGWDDPIRARRGLTSWAFGTSFNLSGWATRYPACAASTVISRHVCAPNSRPDYRNSGRHRSTSVRSSPSVRRFWY